MYINVSKLNGYLKNAGMRSQKGVITFSIPRSFTSFLQTGQRYLSLPRDSGLMHLEQRFILQWGQYLRARSFGWYLQ